MAYLTCAGDIDFSPVLGLISMETVIPLKNGCVIGMYLHTFQTLFVCSNVYFKASIAYC